MFKGYLQYGHLLCKKKNWNWYLQRNEDTNTQSPKCDYQCFPKGVPYLYVYFVEGHFDLSNFMPLVGSLQKTKKCKIARISGFWTLDLVRVMVILSNSKVTLSESLTKCGHRVTTADKVFLKFPNKLFSNHWYERISKGHDVLPCLKQILVIHGGVSN